MPLLGHWPELFFVLLIGLLVFGPKRMIEMGSTLGKAVREMRESLKDIPGMGGSGLQSLLGQDEPRSTPFVSTSQRPRAPYVAPGTEVSPPQAAPTNEMPTATATSPLVSHDVVDGTVERAVDVPED